MLSHDFDPGIVVGVNLTITETADVLRFSCTNIYTLNGLEKKNPVTKCHFS